MNKNFKHNNKPASDQKRTGKIEIVNPIAQLIFDDNTYLEIVAEDLQYADSPVWIDAENLLLFTDFPNKKIYYWKEHYKEPKTYLEPIDFIGHNTKNGDLHSSVLLLKNTAELTLFLYGEHKIAKMNAMIRSPKFNFSAWITPSKDYKITAPSLFIQDYKDNIFFTDVINNSSEEPKENTYGIFKINTKNKLELLFKSTYKVNGIAISPDNKHLYITYSHKKKAYLYRYELSKNKRDIEPIKLFDYTPFISDISINPKGLKIDKFGNIYTTGPDGLWIFNKDAELIARAYFPEVASNCVFSEDYKTLYITATDKVLKLRLRN